MDIPAAAPFLITHTWFSIISTTRTATYKCYGLLRCRLDDSEVLGDLSGLSTGVKRKSIASMMVVGFLLGSLFRVIVMSVFNYLVLLNITPYYVYFIAPLLISIGLPTETILDVVTWSLLLTAVYNVIPSAISVFPAYLLKKESLERVPGIIGGAWIREFLAG